MRRSSLLVASLVVMFARPAFAQEEDQDQPPVENPPPQAPPRVTPSPVDRRGEEDPAAKLRLTMRGALGYQLAPVHGIPISGGRLRLGVGAQNDHSAHYAVLSFLYGGTEEGLRTWDARVGWMGDFLRTGIVRLGVDVEAGYLVVRRVTLDGDRMWALGLGGGVHGSLDLYSFGPRNDHALMLEGRFDIAFHFGPAFMWGPTLLVGFRY
jgi:hypothetical protein